MLGTGRQEMLYMGRLHTQNIESGKRTRRTHYNPN